MNKLQSHSCLTGPKNLLTYFLFKNTSERRCGCGAPCCSCRARTPTSSLLQIHANFSLLMRPHLRLWKLDQFPDALAFNRGSSGKPQPWRSELIDMTTASPSCQHQWWLLWDFTRLMCELTPFLFALLCLLFPAQVSQWIYRWSLPKLCNGQLLQYVYFLLSLLEPSMFS